MTASKATGLQRLYDSLHHLRVELEGLAIEAHGNAALNGTQEDWGAFADDLDNLRAKLEPLCEEARKGGIHSNRLSFDASAYEADRFQAYLDLISELNTGSDEPDDMVTFEIQVPRGHVMMAAMLQESRRESPDGSLAWSDKPMHLLAQDDWDGLTAMAAPTLAFLFTLALENEEVSLRWGRHSLFYPYSDGAYRGYWLTGNWSWSNGKNDIPF
jgi:hypothetical protein